MNLHQYLAKNRVVLIFTPSIEDERFTKQQAIFASQQDDLHERDIVVLHVAGKTQVRLRSQFRVGMDDFEVILVGKDGNEKHRWKNLLASIDQLNHRIDRMPMRRTEMRDRAEL